MSLRRTKITTIAHYQEEIKRKWEVLEKSRELGASGDHLAAIRKKIYEDQDKLIELSSKLGIILPGEPFGKMKHRFESRK